jgi:hypothetical protein
MHARTARYLTLTLIVAATAAIVSARQKSSINLAGEIAVHGYDVVAYADGEALPGSRQFEHRWSGAVWRFTTAERRDRFAREPQKFAPQFGGYCAWAVSRGYTADIDPQAFTIVDGKLYLNYSKSVQRQWEHDIPGNITKAVANWPAVLAK